MAARAAIELDCVPLMCEFLPALSIPAPLITAAFDIETFSSVASRMPVAGCMLDAIIQISVVTSAHSYLLSFGPRLTIASVECRHFETEAGMIGGFVELLHTLQPDLLLGYNTLRYDFNYLIDRAQLLRCFGKLQTCGLNKFARAEVARIKWQSSAFRNQEFVYMPMEGIVIVDLYPLILRDYKLASFTLDSVVKHFLGDQQGKLAVGYGEIFDAWRAQDPARLSRVGEYCVWDSVLCLTLSRSLSLIENMCELAAICYVGMFETFARGQQVRVFSQIYRYCYGKIVLDAASSPASNEIGYVGGRVFDATPQVARLVASLDFRGLYPSIIQAYNVCFSTCLRPNDTTTPESQCHVIEWEDHVGCEHDAKLVEKRQLAARAHKTLAAADLQRKEELASYKPEHVICESRRERFHRTVVGVVPVLVERLIQQRAQAKQEMREHASDSFQYMVLNARQLALKVCANSVYGFFGVKQGFLPFVSAARVITHLGRRTVEAAAEIAKQDWGATIVYGDTDSLYCTFEHIVGIENLWRHAERVAEGVTAKCPHPLRLDFEEAIYPHFMLLSKKRYIYTTCGRDGVTQEKLGKRGCILVRRDSCAWAKQVYERVVRAIFDCASLETCTLIVLDSLHSLVTHSTRLADLTFTKSVGDANGGVLSEETGDGKMRVGDYVVRPPKDLTSDMTLLLPAHVQLACRMRARGEVVENGSRLQIVVTGVEEWAEKLASRLEDVTFFEANSWALNIDYLYYTRALSSPLNQLFWIAFKRVHYMDAIYKTALSKYKCVQMIKSINSRQIRLHSASASSTTTTTTSSAAAAAAAAFH
jgi:DNA polymerase elongation subunit (family B)